MRRLLLRSFLLPWVSAAAIAMPPEREAPNGSAVAVDQLVVAGNACGPAALLNAFRFGNADWRRASDAVAGANDRERILTIIREIGMRPSKHVPGRARWSRRGVNLADLRDMADEMAAGHVLPLFSEDVFFLKSRETPEKLLRRAHRRLETSLAKGLPPILSLRRHVQRSAAGQPPQWVVTDAHFVTLTAIPRGLGKNARSFPVRYIDPWGGRHCQGEIRIPNSPVLSSGNGVPSCLEAWFPQTSAGAKQVRKGQETVLVLSAAIGRW